MKLEKREITLNEADSLLDIYCFENALAEEYGRQVLSVEKKDVKNGLLRMMGDAYEEALEIRALWERSAEGAEK